MKAGFYAIVLISFLSGGLNTISQINSYSQKAATAYYRQDYIEAIAAYEYLLKELEVQDDQLLLNLAHTYYKAGLTGKAQETYRLLADHPSNHLRAVVHFQLGNITASRQKYTQALSLYRQALILEPANETARYNYELLKKYLDLHPEKAEAEEPQSLPSQQEQKDTLPEPTTAEENLEPKPAKKPDAQGNEEEEIPSQMPADAPTDQTQGSNLPQDGIQNEKEELSGSAAGDTEGQRLEDASAGSQQLSGSAENATGLEQRAQTQRARLQQMNISPEKANLLLEAMRNAELQYIQQLPKKATNKPDRTKPDW